MRSSIHVTGVVQGVGFRPHVHRLATELFLTGFVANGVDGVVIEVDGEASAVALFVDRLSSKAPLLARIDAVRVVDIPLGPDSGRGGETFQIVDSVGSVDSIGHGEPGRPVLVPADAALCVDCRRELTDPTDRRFRHAFVNCTSCGPRLTIATSVPYDRATTTMAAFAMCERCRSEYTEPTDRRFHAEANCCPGCGPRLRFARSQIDHVGNHFDANPASNGDDEAIASAIGALRRGEIVAVKGIGGYHLAVDAGNEAAVARLRERKHRDEKPFAIVVRDINAAARLVHLDDDEARLLGGVEAPIVLARRREETDHPIAMSVAPGTTVLGVMLPSSGLQYLLAADFGAPLVMTSGNRSDDPIAFDDLDALVRLHDIADAFVVHDRPIHRRADDSVMRSDIGRTSMLRRARGFVPRTIPMSATDGRCGSVLGVGAELKNTVGLSRGNDALLSAHLGDLENVEVLRSFTTAIVDLRMMLGVEPVLVAHDLHPEYLSTKWALAQNIAVLGVQHHHAHIASCLAEHRHEGQVVGLAFDGHGYGTDGTLWGGECLVADFHGYERVGHLAPVALPGGVTAIRQPWRMAVAHLQHAYEGDVPDDVEVRTRNESQWSDVAWVAQQPTTIRTSSMGRLFDAIAAIIGLRDRASYEGQAATELEQAASRVVASQPVASLAPLTLDNAGQVMLIDPSAFLRSLVDRQREKVAVEDLAWSAHRSLADASIALAASACERSGRRTVAMSGGVFQNALLTSMVRRGLEATGVTVLAHELVPANDGGISLGQIAIGRAHLGSLR